MFAEVTKFEMQSCQWYGLKQIKSSFAGKKTNCGTTFGALPQVVHNIFNNTAFEQYFFNKNAKAALH